MNKKRHWIKLPALLTWLTPIGVFAGLLAGGVGFFGIKIVCPECGFEHVVETGSFNATTVGYAVLGIFIGLSLMMYMIFIAKKDNRIYWISATIGIIIICMSSIALIVGIMLLVLPIAAKGGAALWKISSPDYKELKKAARIRSMMP